MAAQLPAFFFPFDEATALDGDILALCERWPHSPLAPTVGSGPLPDVPVLLLDGEDDLRTPVENAVRTADLFPARRSWSRRPQATPRSAPT